MFEIGSLPTTTSTLLIVGTVLHVWGVVFTSFRLWFRYRTRRLWWDDFWAASALVCDVVCLVAMWVPLDDPFINFEDSPTPAQSRGLHIISIWLSMISYTCVIWFARISIVSSVVRIVPPSRFVRIAALGSGGVFLLMWAYMILCKSVVCSIKSWYDAVVVQCPIPEWVALSEVCTDVLSDIILIYISLRLLWRVKLPSDQRTMVLSVFSTSILVSVVSAIHTIYIIPQITLVGRFTTEVEAAVSLIVCNLLVTITFIYRVIRNGRDLTADLSGKDPGSSNRLTTVDLNFVESSQLSAETRFTETGFSGTNISSLVFRTQADTLSSMTLSVGSVLPDGGLRLGSIPMKQ